MADSGSGEPDFYQRMVSVIERRYRTLANKSLRDVYALDDDFLNTDADVGFAVRNLAKILSILGNPEQ